MEIWLASLDDVDLGPAHGSFSAAELKRAEAIVSAQRRRRFLSRRWVARSLLAGATGEPPELLALERRCERCGSLHPVNPLGAGDRGVWWSASSSGGRAAIAIAGRRVGIDLERCVERRRREGIARRFYSEGEQRLVAGSARRFLELWTLKEAYLKALGVGLPGGLDALDCAGLAPAKGGWSASPEHPGWHFRSPDLAAGHVAALALEGEPEEIRRRDWAELSPDHG